MLTDGPNPDDFLAQPHLIISAARGGPQQAAERENFARRLFAAPTRTDRPDHRGGSHADRRSAGLRRSRRRAGPEIRRRRSRWCSGCGSAARRLPARGRHRERKHGRRSSTLSQPFATASSRSRRRRLKSRIRARRCARPPPSRQTWPRPRRDRPRPGRPRFRSRNPSRPSRSHGRPAAYRAMRCAISSGCSMKFDFDSITPGIGSCRAGSFTRSNTVHS